MRLPRVCMRSWNLMFLSLRRRIDPERFVLLVCPIKSPIYVYLNLYIQTYDTVVPASSWPLVVFGVWTFIYRRVSTY